MVVLGGIPSNEERDKKLKKEKKRQARIEASESSTPSVANTGPKTKDTSIDSNIIVAAGLAGLNLAESGFAPQYVGADTYSDEQLETLAKLITKLKGTKFSDYQEVRRAINTDYPNIAGVGGFEEQVAYLTSRVMPGGDDGSKYGTSTTTQINQYDPTVLESYIDAAYQDKLMRNATKKEKAARMSELMETINKGITTSTTTSKNADGLTNTANVVSAGFSQAGAIEQIGKAAEKESPKALERAQGIHFMDFLNQQMGK